MCIRDSTYRLRKNCGIEKKRQLYDQTSVNHLGQVHRINTCHWLRKYSHDATARGRAMCWFHVVRVKQPPVEIAITAPLDRHFVRKQVTVTSHFRWRNKGTTDQNKLVATDDWGACVIERIVCDVSCQTQRLIHGGFGFRIRVGRAMNLSTLQSRENVPRRYINSNEFAIHKHTGNNTFGWTLRRTWCRNYLPDLETNDRDSISREIRQTIKCYPPIMSPHMTHCWTNTLWNC